MDRLGRGEFGMTIEKFNGYRVFTTTMATQPKKWTLPVFAIRPWVPVSDACRVETDQWLADMFGCHATEVVEHGREPGAFISEAQGALYIHPALYAQLRAASDA